MMPAPPPVDVSIVVVNYRTPDLTIGAVEAAQTASTGLRTEVIVVDNGAADAATLQTALPDALIVAEPSNRGYGAGLNAGIARASGTFLLLLNSDAFAQRGAVKTLVSHLQTSDRAGLVAPRLVHSDGSPQVNAFKRFPNLLTVFFDFCAPLHLLNGTRLHPHALPRRAFSGSSRRVAHVMGAVMLVRADAAEQVGVLDERFFMYLEETDWQRRMTALGWEVHLDATATFSHLERASSGAAVISPYYLESAQKYFRHPALTRAVMRAGARISVTSARLASRLRPDDPRFPKLVVSYREVLDRTRTARS
jgi:GT2 family glycosyltransferase